MGMSRIFWDTNLFIYLFEDSGRFSQRVAEMRKRMRERGDELITSTLTLGEILVKPMEDSDEALRRTYRDAILTQAQVVAFDEEVAEHYALIRTDRSIRPPDAIQLACARKAKVHLFVTNDEKLSKKNIPGVQFIATLESAPL
jgi:predicted nucleic acid-binding protein